MAAVNSRMQTLNLYKMLLRESEKFTNYNFRMYAKRKVRDSFRENKNLQDPAEMKLKLDEATKGLVVIKRQVVVGGLYSTEKLIIEK